MLMHLNLDDDIMDEVTRDLDPQGAWFSNLPVKVQLKKLAPYVRRQAKRDRLLLEEAA